MAVNFVHVGASQNEDNDILWAAHITVDGDKSTGSGCTVTLYECDGSGDSSAVASATETVATPDSQDVFNGTFTGITLTAGTMYYIEAKITYSAVEYSNALYFFVPVRAA